MLHWCQTTCRYHRVGAIVCCIGIRRRVGTIVSVPSYVASDDVGTIVSVPSYVTLVSDDVNEPVYIMKVEEKGRTEKEVHDEDGHVISAGDLFIFVRSI